MKRYLFLSFIFVFSLGLLAACGQGGETENEGENVDTGSQEEPASEEEATTEEASDNEDDVTNSETPSEEEGESATESSSEEETTGNNAAEESVTETVTLYFSDQQLLETYKEEQEVTASSEDELPKAALEAWIDGPNHEELVSHFNEDIEVQSVEGEGSVAEVSFSETFLDANAGSSAELAITDQIALIMQQFGYEETKILIDGEEQPSLFGHLDATEPIAAPSPDDYESIE